MIVNKLTYKVRIISSVIGIFGQKMVFYIRLNKKNCEIYI